MTHEPIIFTVEELSQLRWAMRDRIKRYASGYPAGMSMDMCVSALDKLELELEARK